MKRTCRVVIALLLCFTFAVSVPAAAQTVTSTDRPEETPVITRLGDVNGNAAIDAGDALQMLQYSVELRDRFTADSPYWQELADVTGDGAITPGDALETLQVSVGKQEEFRREEERGAVLQASDYEPEPMVSGWIDFDGFDPDMPGRRYFKSPADRVYGYGIAYSYGFAHVLQMMQDARAYIAEHDYQPYGPLLLVANNLHLYTDCLNCDLRKAFESGLESEASAAFIAGKLGLYCLQQFEAWAATVPDAVNAVCDDEAMTWEEKLVALDYYGMLALPTLADRIEAGEEQWSICFETQLLGLPIRERYQVIQRTYTDVVFPEGEICTVTHYVPDNWQQQVYAIKAAAAKPLDVPLWIETHATELQELRILCTAPQE